MTGLIEVLLFLSAHVTLSWYFFANRERGNDIFFKPYRSNRLLYSAWCLFLSMVPEIEYERMVRL